MMGRSLVFVRFLAAIAALLVTHGVVSAQQWDPLPGAFGYEPDMAMDDDGNVHVVFLTGSDPYDVRYVRYNASSGGWGSVVVLPGSGDIWELFGKPKVAVGPDGIPHVVWMTYALTDLVYAHATSPTGTQWTVTHINVEWCAFPDVAVDDQNNPHFVFQRIDATGGTGWHLVYRDAGGSEVSIYGSADENYKPNQPAIECGPGVVHVAWQQSDGDRGNVYYANSWNWDSAELLSPGVLPAWSAGHPHLAVSPTTGTPGVTFFVDDWATGGYHRGVYFSQPGGEKMTELWSCYAKLPEESYPWNYDYYPEIGYDAAGNRLVAWTVHDYGKTYYKINSQSAAELDGAGQIGVAGGWTGAMMVRRNPNASGQLYWAQFGDIYLPPTAHIDDIDPDTAYTFVDDVEFLGSAWDNDEGGESIVAYQWSSSLDGVLSQDEDFSLPASSLSIGTHTITFRAQDNEGDWGQDTETLVVLSGDAPPAPVTNLQAFDTPQDQGGSISLTWTRSADDGAGANDVESYRVERREDQHGLQYDTITELPAGSQSYADTTSQDGTLYYYRIVAIDAIGQETASAPAGPVTSGDDWVTPPGDLVAADVADDQGGAIQLTWTLSAEDGADVDDVVEYRVRRAAAGESLYTRIATLPAGSQSYTDETVDDLVLYSYVIRAVDDDGNLGDSSPASATPHDNLDPGAIPNLQGMCIGLEGWVFLSWDPSPDDTTGAEDVVNYRVRRRSAQGASYQLIATIEPNEEGEYYYVDQTTASGARYYYLVRAFDGENLSDDSDIIEIYVTPADDGPGTAAPDRLVLAEVSPNPVRDVLQVTYGLPAAAHATLSLRNVCGQTVATIDKGMRQAGYHTATYRVDGGSGSVGSGMVFVVLESEGARFVQRVIVAE